ncbi:MAG: alcohol dehydrogenase, partial [Phaeodactylibacter sp.]|nr:alcohol dehydrogenase [Phaeodactylibacter sp.]
GELTFLHPKIHAKESTIICSRNATLEDFLHVVQVLPQFPTDTFITHEVAFDDLVGQFESFTKPENQVIKAVIHL